MMVKMIMVIMMLMIMMTTTQIICYGYCMCYLLNGYSKFRCGRVVIFRGGFMRLLLLSVLFFTAITGSAAFIGMLHSLFIVMLIVDFIRFIIFLNNLIVSTVDSQIYVIHFNIVFTIIVVTLLTFGLPSVLFVVIVKSTRIWSIFSSTSIEYKVCIRLSSSLSFCKYYSIDFTSLLSLAPSIFLTNDFLCVKMNLEIWRRVCMNLWTAFLSR